MREPPKQLRRWWSDLLAQRQSTGDAGKGTATKQKSETLRFLLSEPIFGKGMRTATFQFSESGGSLNGPDLFVALPVEILTKPLIH